MIHMRCIASVFFIILLCILVCGCIFQPSASPSAHNQTGTLPAYTMTTVPTPIAGSVIAILEKTHPNMTFSLDPGAYIISIRAQETVDLVIDFRSVAHGLDEFGGYLQSFNTTGPYNGSVAMVIPKKGKYHLEIRTHSNFTVGEGIWTAEVSPLPEDNPLKVPVHISGAGRMVTPPFYLDKGEYIFERNETLPNSPNFKLFYADGSFLRDLNGYVQPNFNQNSPKKFTDIIIPESGTYFLSVATEKSPHYWAASIFTLPKTPLSSHFPVFTNEEKAVEIMILNLERALEITRVIIIHRYGD